MSYSLHKMLFDQLLDNFGMCDYQFELSPYMTLGVRRSCKLGGVKLFTKNKTKAFSTNIKGKWVEDEPRRFGYMLGRASRHNT